MKRKLLLISNSTNPGEDYLGWPTPFIKSFIEKHNIKEFLFFPWAGVNLTPEGPEASYDIYLTRVAGVFSSFGCTVRSIHKEADPIAAVRNSSAIMVGGGNTFHLVGMMHSKNVMQEIRKKVTGGAPFIGWSAGANVACPTMKTTNDMPIFEPESFDCLGLIPFQINPHYLDANPAGHGGETREQRINEFLTINRSMTVAGLRESSLFEVEDDKIELKGYKPLRVFRFGNDPVEIMTGDDVGFLLG